MLEPRRLVRPFIPLVILSMLLGAHVQAQEPGEADPQEPRARPGLQRWSFELGFEGLLFDNFFQAPDGAPSTTVEAARVSGRFEVRPQAEGPLVLVASGARTAYGSGLADSTAVAGGARIEASGHALDLMTGVESGRPILDVGDEFETADVFFVEGEYGYRVADDWEVKALLGLQSQSFEVSADKDNTLVGFGPAVRYRGFGSGFSPEAGVLFGGRSAADREEDHSQTDWYFKVRSVPADRVYLSVRYRHRLRDYSIDRQRARNFGREDTRNQLTALLVYPTDGRLALTVYYAYQSADSTLPSRTFDTQMIMAGLTWSVR